MWCVFCRCKNVRRHLFSRGDGCSSGVLHLFIIVLMHIVYGDGILHVLYGYMFLGWHLTHGVCSLNVLGLNTHLWCSQPHSLKPISEYDNIALKSQADNALNLKPSLVALILINACFHIILSSFHAMFTYLTVAYFESTGLNIIQPLFTL